jgi:hypothetical protein
MPSWLPPRQTSIQTTENSGINARSVIAGVTNPSSER